MPPLRSTSTTSGDSKLPVASPDPPPTFPSPLFCDPNANVTFISVDRVIFKMYSGYFGAVSAGFSAPESTVIDQLVSLPETAQVLTILFQFIHPPFHSEHFHQPSVIKMDVKLLFDVATAAEKYVVYAAMNVCVTRMHYELYLSHPIEVLNHAANHGYTELADKAAAKTVSLSNPLQRTLMGLTDPKVAVKWTKYFGHFLQIPTIANDFQRTGLCPRYNEMVVDVLHNLATNPTKTEITIGTIKAACHRASFPTCDCRSFIEKCQNLLNIKIKNIPRFSQIL